MIKRVLVLGVVVVALMAAGVIHFQKTGDEVNIRIDRAKLRRVSGRLIDEGGELLDDAQQALQDRRNQDSDLQSRFESGFEHVEAEAERFKSEFQNQSRRFTPSRERR